MPFAPSSILIPVVRPGAPSSVKNKCKFSGGGSRESHATPSLFASVSLCRKLSEHEMIISRSRDPTSQEQIRKVWVDFGPSGVWSGKLCGF